MKSGKSGVCSRTTQLRNENQRKHVEAKWGQTLPDYAEMGEASEQILSFGAWARSPACAVVFSPETCFTGEESDTVSEEHAIHLHVPEAALCLGPSRSSAHCLDAVTPRQAMLCCSATPRFRTCF